MASRNYHVNAGEAVMLESLDQAVQNLEKRNLLGPIIDRVHADLKKRNEAVMAWEPIPLTAFDRNLPAGIKSAWVFILRAGSNTGAERHPNSHQRMVSFTGAGDMQIRADWREPWRSNRLVSDPAKPLPQRWISIPPNTWHQPVISPAGDWVVVSFHTVEPQDLIEERPDDGVEGATKQKRYLD